MNQNSIQNKTTAAGMSFLRFDFKDLFIEVSSKSIVETARVDIVNILGIKLADPYGMKE